MVNEDKNTGTVNDIDNDSKYENLSNDTSAEDDEAIFYMTEDK